MKKCIVLFLFVFSLQFSFAQLKYVYHGSGNPYLPLWEHLPDGEPRVFEDPDNPGKFRAYVIGSHDVRFTSYCGPDIRMWSAPVEDLSSWRDEGAIFTYPISGQWDVMYAPDLVEIKKKDGKKEYYLYPHSRGWNREAMVAKGSRPDGPFTPINLNEDGTKTLQGSVFGFDPAVYVDYVTNTKDPDFETGFRAYGYWGFQRSNAAQLDQKTMYSARPGTEIANFMIPASYQYGVIRDPKGTLYPNVFVGQDLGTFNFFEASSIRKIGNKYVTIFSGFSGPDYGIGSSNSTLRFAYADSPLGPWKSGGVVVDSRAPVLNEDGSKIITSNAGHNTHGSIEQINGQWYVFYHRPPRGFGFARQAMVAPIIIECDEKTVAQGGAVTIKGYDTYSQNHIWTAKDSQGNEYKGAEVTSEGFHIFGLNPYQYYSAGYACYLSDVSLQQDSWDIWDNNMPITNVKNGTILGYKYFGFGGLKKAERGLKAFEGVKKGNQTAFNIFITPKTAKSFKVNVWLDGPWDNAAWKGKKIGEIVVPANSTQEITKFTIDVSKFVDNLDKKHAIFLVAESDEQGSLFDFIGLGFSSKKIKIEYSAVPKVSITVNGKPIELPLTPVRSTNENGITGFDIYGTTVKLPATESQTPVVAAQANNQGVKISIAQATSTTGTAVVKCDFNGVVKTYKITFALETLNSWKDINYINDNQVYHKLDIYLPAVEKPSYKAIVVIYGSAWFGNNLKQTAFDIYGKSLLDNGFAVISINHRASTDATYPAQINDVKAAIRFIRGNAEKYKIDASFIGITGFSSGGHLAALSGATNGVKDFTVGAKTVNIEGNLGDYTSFSSDVNAVVDWFGPIDFTRMEGCTKTKDGKSPEAVLIKGNPADNLDMLALISPMTYIDAKDPKFIVIHGDADNVVPYCQSEFFSKALKEKGLLDEYITVPGGQHGPVTFNENTFKKMTDFFVKEAGKKK